MHAKRAGVAYEPLGLPRLIVVMATLAITFWYLVWRLDTFNPDALWFSRLLYAAESFGAATLLLHAFMVSRLALRQALPPPAGHSVDVFIPTLDEPLDVVRRTAVKAVS